MATSTHGVHQIRTRSAAKRGGVQGGDRHVHQFRLAALELECSRLLYEKQTAERRIDGILGQLAEIHQEMRQHRELLDRGQRVEEPSAPRAAARILRY
jgi:hypothetical protein